jgi:hypothetical protein
MDHRNVRDCALLVGYNPEGDCIYSAEMPLDQYWDGEHVWDEVTGIKELRLERLRGYLFDSSGELLQEFESIFDLGTGTYMSGWQRHSDGTYQEHAA